MSENIKQDISNLDLNYTYILLMSKKLKVGIIGGGRAAVIKAKSFVDKGCYVEVISKSFNENLINIQDKNLKLVYGDYKKEFIKDKHIIVIAINDDKLIERIEKHCNDETKIYVNATNFKKGIAIIPVQRESKSLNIAISTKMGNPKGSLLVAKEALNILKRYDDFIEYSSKIRNNAKKIEEYKKDIIDFVCTEDFKYIYNKKKDKLVLKMFFDGELVKELYK